MASKKKPLTPEQFRTLMAGEQDRTKAHNDLVNLIITFLSSIGIRAWRCDTGRNVVHTGAGWARGKSYGTKGAADITGIVPPCGRRLEIEVKTGGAVLSPVQVIFLKVIHQEGGIAIWARSITDVAEDPDIVEWRERRTCHAPETGPSRECL